MPNVRYGGVSAGAFRVWAPTGTDNRTITPLPA